jgi:hypothetical protein
MWEGNRHSMLVMAGRWLVAPASSFLRYCRAILTKHAVGRNKKKVSQIKQVSSVLLKCCL